MMRLDDPLSKHFRLIKTQKNALAKLGVHTVADLLMHIPSRYEDIGAARHISEITPNETVTIYGELSDLTKTLSWKTKKYVVEGWVADTTGRIKIRWFSQPYIVDMLQYATTVKVTGKVSGKGTPYFANPTVESIAGLPDFLQEQGEGLFPIYPESKGITSRWFYHAVHRCLEHIDLHALDDYIPAPIRKKYALPTLASALVWIHAPQHRRDQIAARKRFAFDEVFAIQVSRLQDRALLTQKHALRVSVDMTKTNAFIKTFPYTLTNAQQRAITDVLTDFAQGTPMSRLLEGDVGSGKTAVAAATVYAVATSRPLNEKTGKPAKAGNLQTAYMVPTEILAKQQFANFIEFFKELPLNIGLLTSSGCFKYPSKTDPTQPTKISRTQLLKWIANGEIPIVVGTHSLIQKTVQFKNLAYVIIDEQHRFGTIQRKTLARKDKHVPHLLSMTATPIPRTLALTIYGDLDLTLLDEMPLGRKDIITSIISPTAREQMYSAIRAELSKGRQAYVICPRIEEPDPTKASALRMKSVTEEAQRLRAGAFKGYTVGILHGKMTPTEKEETMQKFAQGVITILVATSVVEVGVNVPNATVIVIEGAERFGLSQLHQLRGRVRRSTKQPYCYLLSESKSEKSVARLKALVDARDGFALAEKDLELRGAGELYGAHQWGITDIGMEAIKNIKMVEAARTEAQALIATDPTLSHYRALKEFIEKKHTETHFE